MRRGIPPFMQERVQKIIARSGKCSRRGAESLIEEGEVTINGKRAKLGDKATAGVDHIKVSGHLLQMSESPAYYLFHKPAGILSTMEDPRRRPNLSLLSKQIKERVFPIAKLPFNAEGLMILTNDGEFGQRFNRNKNVPIVYEVKVKGHPDDKLLKGLAKGMRTSTKMVRPVSVRIKQTLKAKSKIELVFAGSLHFELGEFLQKKGFLVEKVVRTQIGPFKLPKVSRGGLLALSTTQIDALFATAESVSAVLQNPAPTTKPKVRPSTLKPKKTDHVGKRNF